jgi:hypothetical protein
MMATPPPSTPDSLVSSFQLETPVSLNCRSPKSIWAADDAHCPPRLTHEEIDTNPKLKRLQQDLLILTGFDENSTLHWKPAWFTDISSNKKMWTLHNPPNVVTERLPYTCGGVQMFTRRMRTTCDPPAQYIVSWDHWMRYCNLYGIPYNFLCGEQVQLMRMGLSRSPNGSLCSEFLGLKTYLLLLVLTVFSTTAIPTVPRALQPRSLSPHGISLHHSPAPQVQTRPVRTRRS